MLRYNRRMLSILGLVFNLVGTVVLAWDVLNVPFSLEKFKHRARVESAQSEGLDTAQRQHDAGRKGRNLALLGLSLVLVGFALQLTAACLATRNVPATPALAPTRPDR